MKRVVITGATGFLGGALAMRFLKNNVKVYGVGTNEEKFERFTSFKNFVPIIARFEDYPKLSEIILERDFDVFIILHGREFLGIRFKTIRCS